MPQVFGCRTDHFSAQQASAAVFGVEPQGALILQDCATATLIFKWNFTHRKVSRGDSELGKILSGQDDLRIGKYHRQWGSAYCAARTASAAAISNLLGMQPTRAQVVPKTPPSVTRTLRVCASAARYADIPAVPTPMMSTSTFKVFIVSSLVSNRCVGAQRVL